MSADRRYLLLIPEVEIIRQVPVSIPVKQIFAINPPLL
jgi:hypothetical protein